MAPKKRLKSTAAVYVPQHREQVVADIKSIGDLSRELARLETAMNDEIGKITERYSAPAEDLKTRLTVLQTGVQSWCEANRAELTENHRVKFANLITGEVQWRIRPPSVTVRGADAVLELLRAKELIRFIRVKEEVNKEAILNEPEAIKGVPGIIINSGIEDFAIVPFEQEVQ
ncbi:host-nuclease inhibitor Gam family protein [Pseudomonas citronellolis]|uniref:host-nuclease inhibitor Gam family protein n=1 Tax=Pseudomonas citronellolis TaxID=53408 RepID=UPI00209DD27B|nr:host-nuclease inhibitor Gam family protein [Pseudomonas citronellolis]MCP1606434.1 phage host-nuclease inhibitor protein Gam [Pseudomonas citronellolis]MCP1657140.1 phage host-nuclease inhibitor protein Gam [Pseudomonas citronellolis]MCP1724127.1 phage host-nuclease inhibitor protein Gam [Pseudomonas citronellolis]